MSTQSRNPRRVVLPVLRSLKKNVETMIHTWDQRQSTHWVPDENGVERWAADAVMLTPQEKRENQWDQWVRLAEFMDTIAAQAADVRMYALARAHEVERGKRW